MKKQSLQEVLYQNKLETRKIEIERIRQLKKQNKKERRLAVFIATFIVIGTLMIMFSILRTDDTKAINHCLENGHTKQFCEKNLYGY